MSRVKGGMHEMMNMNDSEGPVVGTDNSNDGCAVNKKRRLVKSSCKEDKKTDHRSVEVKKAQVEEDPVSTTGARSENCGDCIVSIEKEENKEKTRKRAEVGKLEQNPWSTLFPSLKRVGSKTKPSEKLGVVVPETNPPERQGGVVSETKPSERQGLTEPKTKHGEEVSSIKLNNIMNDTIWKAGEPVPFSALCKTLKAIEDTSSRLDITETLRKFFMSVIALTPQDLEACVYLACGKVSICTCGGDATQN